MQRGAGAATPQVGRESSGVPVAPRRSRAPVVLLVLLPLLLAAALLAVALAPAPRPATAGDDPMLAAALAAVVTEAQSTMLASAGQAPLARVLAGASPAPGALDRARAVLASLAADLGDPNGSVALIDASGRTRLAREADGRDPTPLPASARDLGRVLALRGGALVTSTGEEGRTIVFAVRVDGPGGEAIGALVAAVPVSALLAAATGAQASTGGIAPGSVDTSTWSAVAALSGSPASPLPQALLLALAALSLLAMPLGWWALRPARGPRETTAAASATSAPASAPMALSGHAVVVAGLATGAPRASSVAGAAAPPSAPATQGAPALSAAADTTDASAPGAGRRLRFRSRKPAEVAVDAPPTPATAHAAAIAPIHEELTDALSGLGNHRAFHDELDRLFTGWERNRVPFALMLIDLDDLGITNIRAGRGAGDEQLRAMGRRVREMLRFSDRAYRTGGDEFAVLLPHTDAAGAVHLGQRLLGKVRAAEDGEPSIAFSAGVADFPAMADDRDQLLANAGAALAWCKAHGRASVQAFEPNNHTVENDGERTAMMHAVAEVIRDRSLRAVFQPIVDMGTGEVVGYEGLTRPAPGAPFTNPGALFEAAEAAGRTVELDAACFETIAAGARAIPTDRVVSINLSPRTIEAADFSVAGVLAVLAANELDPGRVILELTERETVLDLDRLRDNLSELQRAGVRIAADDVGAGNAGLRLLSQFRFDIVKVDLSLVQEGASNDSSQAVLRSLRDLAQRWGAFVIAEGIETATQLRVVRELGLAAGQGYLIGRPGTIVDLPPVDLDGLVQGQLMLQAAPVPGSGTLPRGLPA